MQRLRHLLAATMITSPVICAEPLRLTSFDPAESNLNWQIVNDTVMGGRSSSRFTLKDQQLTFSGTLNTQGGGFASLRSGRQSWPLADHSTIRLRVKGDGRTYRLRLFVDNDRAAYQHAFETNANQWQIVTLPIDAFYASWRGRRLARPPLQAVDVVGIGLIVADGIDGPFSLTVDWIEADTAG